MRGLVSISNFYRKGSSVKRSGPFSELPDSENRKVAVLIPFPKISSETRSWQAFGIHDDFTLTEAVLFFVCVTISTADLLENVVVTSVGTAHHLPAISLGCQGWCLSCQTWPEMLQREIPENGYTACRLLDTLLVFGPPIKILVSLGQTLANAMTRILVELARKLMLGSMLGQFILCQLQEKLFSKSHEKTSLLSSGMALQ